MVCPGICIQCIVLGGYLRILSAPSVQHCCTLSISASYRVFVYDKYRKSRFVWVWIRLDITHFNEEQRQPSSGSAWPACPKTVNRAHIAGAGGFDTIFTAVCNSRGSSTGCRLCGLEIKNPSSHSYKHNKKTRTPNYDYYKYDLFVNSLYIIFHDMQLSPQSHFSISLFIEVPAF